MEHSPAARATERDRAIALVLLLGLAAAPSGCGVEGPPLDPAAEPETTASEIVGGTASYAHPEVGMLALDGRYCTATLIAPTVALTAAHCVAFRSGRVLPSQSWALRIYRSATRWTPFFITEYRAFGTAYDSGDLAVVRLAERVPAGLARPAALAAASPRVGTPVTLWGFGCNARAGSLRDGVGTKRRFDSTSGAITRAVCPGDSGGPCLDAQGALFGVMSAYVYSLSSDLVVSVPPRDAVRARALRDQVAAWAEPAEP